MSRARARVQRQREAAQWYIRLLQDARDWRSRAALARWVLARKLAAGEPPGRPKPIEAQLGPFTLIFSDEDELAPYWQIEADIRSGVLPVGSETREWTVVDCGANIGLFSLFVRSARHLLTVEPNPACCRVLRRNLERNRVRAIIIQAAVSAQPGTMRMTVGRRSTVYAEVADQGDVEVKAVTIDQILAEQGVGEVDLLKLDLEGHELEALKGATQALTDRRISRIYTEFTSSEALRSLDGYLAPYGLVRAATGSLNARYELRVSYKL